MSERTNLPAITEARLPYHPAIEERFGIDRASWRALTDAVFPLATSSDSIILALSYCRARKLDPFKKAVHIVPVYSKERGGMVDTVWPGIGELRTTAFRTGLYAGRDDAEYGPDVTRNLGGVEITFPEWCRITVYRMCGTERRAFAGPKAYWLETYATRKRDTTAPNEMWFRRPRGQLEKCAEAAALRSAFPEELGDAATADEMAGQVIEGVVHSDAPPRPSRERIKQEMATVVDAEPMSDPNPPREVEAERTQEPEVPTFYFLSADGEEIACQGAEFAVKAFMDHLREVWNTSHDAARATYDDNANFIDAVVAAGMKRPGRPPEDEPKADPEPPKKGAELTGVDRLIADGNTCINIAEWRRFVADTANERTALSEEEGERWNDYANARVRELSAKK